MFARLLAWASTARRFHRSGDWTLVGFGKTRVVRGGLHTGRKRRTKRNNKGRCTTVGCRLRVGSIHVCRRAVVYHLSVTAAQDGRRSPSFPHMRKSRSLNHGFAPVLSWRPVTSLSLAANLLLKQRAGAKIGLCAGCVLAPQLHACLRRRSRVKRVRQRGQRCDVETVEVSGRGLRDHLGGTLPCDCGLHRDRCPESSGSLAGHGAAAPNLNCGPPFLMCARSR
jgi:hypothetical protein